MNKTLVISESQVAVLVEFYTNKINELDLIIEPYLKQREVFQDLVNQLNFENSNEVVKPIPKQKETVVRNLFENGSSEEYKQSWSMPKKGYFALKQAGKPLSTSEVFDILVKHEPKLSDKRRNVMVLISADFGDRSKKGDKYYRIGKNRLNFKYGLIEWKKQKEEVQPSSNTILNSVDEGV